MFREVIYLYVTLNKKSLHASISKIWISFHDLNQLTRTNLAQVSWLNVLLCSAFEIFALYVWIPRSEWKML